MASAAAAALERAKTRRADPIANESKLRRRRATLATIMGAPKPDEHHIQAAFIDWVLANQNLQPDLKLGFAVPNGGGRNKGQAGRLKAEGVRKGVPDWCLPIERTQRWRGLLIEFKTESAKSVLTDEQAWYLGAMKARGWCCVVARTVEFAIYATSCYLKGNGQAALELFEAQQPKDYTRIDVQAIIETSGDGYTKGGKHAR